MGLFDDLAGSLKGAVFNAAEEGVHAVLADAVSNTTAGGMEGLLSKLQASGLGDQVSSWLASGHNLPVSADQLQAALGDEHVQQLAASLGLPLDKALEGLAEHLPGLVSAVASSKA